MIELAEHYHKLEHLYLTAPFNERFNPSIRVSEDDMIESVANFIKYFKGI